MIGIDIAQAAFDALAATLPFRSVGYENQINERARSATSSGTCARARARGREQHHGSVRDDPGLHVVQFVGSDLERLDALFGFLRAVSQRQRLPLRVPGSDQYQWLCWLTHRGIPESRRG